MLRPGSTITPYVDIARVFSHKPRLVSMDCEDDNAPPSEYTIRHSGARPGFLYRVAEPVRPDDIYQQPAAGPLPDEWEWLTGRELCVELIGPTTPRTEELLTEAEAADLLRRGDWTSSS